MCPITLMYLPIIHQWKKRRNIDIEIAFTYIWFNHAKVLRYSHVVSYVNDIFTYFLEKNSNMKYSFNYVAFHRPHLCGKSYVTTLLFHRCYVFTWKYLYNEGKIWEFFLISASKVSKISIFITTLHLYYITCHIFHRKHNSYNYCSMQHNIEPFRNYTL